MKVIPSIGQVEAQAFKTQQTAFCVLSLFVIAALLILHAIFAPLLGEPTRAVILILASGFGWKVAEVIWLQRHREGISERTAQIETAVSVIGLFALAAVLAFLTNKDDPPYFVLLAIPILQVAYHCSFVATNLTIAGAIAMMFAWSTFYFTVHPPPRATQYLETGMIAVIYCLTGPLVWYLVNQLRRKESSLYHKVVELESTREKLVAEERLAAVGRLASGIAHEIRNPVAMIASSLATANYPSINSQEREEMFAIALRESKRLEHLTGDFLTYARPTTPRRSPVAVSNIVRHIVDLTKLKASDHSIDVVYESAGEIFAELDTAQVEGALLNLTLNAVEATPPNGRITVRSRAEGQMLCLDVENSGMMIPDPIRARIFEPFFTTKPQGTGLGLAITRGVALAHGGDLFLGINHDGMVSFTMVIPVSSAAGVRGAGGDGESSHS